MHKVKSGPASKSYGLQVAKLAGVPTSVISEAEHYLQQLSANSMTGESGARSTIQVKALDQQARSATRKDSSGQEPNQLINHSTSQAPHEALSRALADIDPDQLTPKQAHEWLYKLKTLL